MRAHQQGSEPRSLGSAVPTDFSGKARRRQSVPQVVLEKELADFNEKQRSRSIEPLFFICHSLIVIILPGTADDGQVLLKHTAASPERRPSNSALPRINKFSSTIPREAKFHTQNGFLQRTQSIPKDHFDHDELVSTLGSVNPPTRNVYSYPLALNSLDESDPMSSPRAATAWGQNKPTSRSKHKAPSGLTMRPASSVADGGGYDVEETPSLRERLRRKISPGDHHLPALEHGSPQRVFVKSKR